MSDSLYVALIWHQHQPLYKSQGKYSLPWVRLHGTKDYLDLVLLLEKYPQLHQTVNLVPSLILQLEDYSAGVAMDPYLALTLTPCDKIPTNHKYFMVNNFFSCNYQTMIAPHPRYRELYSQKQERGEAWCGQNWTGQDWSDLLAWHNLAWIDPLFWDDPEIALWLKQGENFNLGDRLRIYGKQREIISRIIPQHRKMQEVGQLEVITSPYTHPILPLLADTNSGGVALPEMKLPQKAFQWCEDIPRHLQKAREIYRARFGRNPRGLWPSEQSVSPGILPYIAQEGFHWICSDEVVLGSTLKHYFRRDEVGNVSEPELLYRPYRLETKEGNLVIVFRDHCLSDLIGFTYSTRSPQGAAKDLVRRLEVIAGNRSRQDDQQPWLVTIALDGENCWEYYQQDGLPFLQALYERLSKNNKIKLVTVSEFLHKFPNMATIPGDNLHSGSWVDGSFSTWIGSSTKNRAWDLLREAREVLANHPEATEENNPEVWESLYAAEGSDWFWWFDRGHSSFHDSIFDQLFRDHLIAIYRGLKEPVPPRLLQPVQEREVQGPGAPESFISPGLDGRGREEDWQKAGKIEIGDSRGTMQRSSLVQQVYYGWDQLHFYFRFDFQGGVQLPGELHLLWYYRDITMYNSPVLLTKLPDIAPLNYLFHHDLGINLLNLSIGLEEAVEDYTWQSRVTRAVVAFHQCLELAVPWADLQVQPDYPLELLVILAEDGQFHSYLPENELIRLQVP